MNYNDKPGSVNIADLPFKIEKDLFYPKATIYWGYSLAILGFIGFLVMVIGAFLENLFILLYAIFFLISVLFVAFNFVEMGWPYRHPGYALVHPDKIQCYEYDKVVKEVDLDPSVRVNVLLGYHYPDIPRVNGYRFQKGADEVVISTRAGYNRSDIERMWELFTIQIRKHHLKGDQRTADYLIEIRKRNERIRATEGDVGLMSKGYYLESR